MKKLKYTIMLILAVYLLILSFLIDRNVLFLFENARSAFFDPIMLWITNFGSLFVVLFVIPSLFSYRGKKFDYMFYLWATFFFSFVTAFILKGLIMRPRPLAGIEFASAINFSFPSMHALVAFAAIPILDREFPKLRIFWILFAFFVAVSRLYFGYHFFSDVVGGALIGYMIGLMFVNLEQLSKKFKTVNKK